MDSPLAEARVREETRPRQSRSKTWVMVDWYRKLGRLASKKRGDFPSEPRHDVARSRAIGVNLSGEARTRPMSSSRIVARRRQQQARSECSHRFVRTEFPFRHGIRPASSRLFWVTRIMLPWLKAPRVTRYSRSAGLFHSRAFADAGAPVARQDALRGAPCLCKALGEVGASLPTPFLPAGRGRCASRGTRGSN